MQSGNHSSKFCYTTYYLLHTMLLPDEKKKPATHLYFSPEYFLGMEVTNTHLPDIVHSMLVTQPLMYRKHGPGPVQDFSITFERRRVLMLRMQSSCYKCL